MKSRTTILRYITSRILYIKNKLFLSKKIVTGAHGIKYFIVPGSSLDYIIKKDGFLDDWGILQHLKTSIPQDSTIFDIGANVGHLSLPFAKEFVPNGHVFSYEPDPENSIQLSENIKLNNLNNITPLAIALQDDDKVLSIDFNIRRTIDGDGNQNRGLSSIKHIDKFLKNTLSVTSSTVDKEVERLHIEKVGLIKIDVEGAEHLVLEGAVTTIEKWHPIIQYEYSNILDKLMNENNTGKTFIFLQNLGYRQFYVNKDGSVVELINPDNSIPDVNILCFYKNEIPTFFLKKQ